MSVTLLDGIFVVIILLSAILGYARGLLREAIGLVCFGVALALTYIYIVNAGIVQWTRPSFRWMASYVFLGTTIVTFLVAAWVSHFGMAPWITTPSRILGLLFGIVRGLLIFAIGVALLVVFVGPRNLPSWFMTSRAAELSGEYMRLFWPKDWVGLRILTKPFVMMGVAALFLSVVTDVIAALSRPFRLRLRR